MKPQYITQTFPMSISPVNPGVYKIEVKEISFYKAGFRWARWDGNQWKCWGFTFKEAALNTVRSSSCYSSAAVGWFGIAKE